MSKVNRKYYKLAEGYDLMNGIDFVLNNCKGFTRIHAYKLYLDGERPMTTKELNILLASYREDDDDES